MTTFLRRIITLCFVTALPLAAQDSVPAISDEVEESTLPERTDDQLDDLLGPVALYPDALIALILPAATVPSDVVLAARFLAEGGNEAAIDEQAWDESVKALAHYPDVIKWMDENLAWTKQVGEVFMTQPAEVMNSVQRLRARARAAGTLIDTPEQKVVVEQEVIRIVPTQPDVIYVPYYDYDVVYVDRPWFHSRPFFTFSVGFAVGSWLRYDCDWFHRRIWVGHRDYWRRDRDWRHHDFPRDPHWRGDSDWRPWRPRPHAWHSFRNDRHEWRRDVVRPAPIHREPWRSNRNDSNSTRGPRRDPNTVQNSNPPPRDNSSERAVQSRNDSRWKRAVQRPPEAAAASPAPAAAPAERASAPATPAPERRERSNVPWRQPAPNADRTAPREMRSRDGANETVSAPRARTSAVPRLALRPSAQPEAPRVNVAPAERAAPSPRADNGWRSRNNSSAPRVRTEAPAPQRQVEVRRSAPPVARERAQPAPRMSAPAERNAVASAPEPRAERRESSSSSSSSSSRSDGGRAMWRGGRDRD